MYKNVLNKIKVAGITGLAALLFLGGNSAYSQNQQNSKPKENRVLTDKEVEDEQTLSTVYDAVLSEFGDDYTTLRKQFKDDFVDDYERFVERVKKVEHRNTKSIAEYVMEHPDRPPRDGFYRKKIKFGSMEYAITFIDKNVDIKDEQPNKSSSQNDKLEIEVLDKKSEKLMSFGDYNLDGFWKPTVRDYACGIPGVKGISADLESPEDRLKVQNEYRSVLSYIKRKIDVDKILSE